MIVPPPTDQYGLTKSDRRSIRVEAARTAAIAIQDSFGKGVPTGIIRRRFTTIAAIIEQFIISGDGNV